jgi:peroxiredoxin
MSTNFWLPVALIAGLGPLPLFTLALPGFADPVPAIGDKAADFGLKALDGKAVKLSAETAKGPVALLVLRGYPGYQCPLCTRQVSDFLGKAAEFKKAGATVLMVYPGPAADLDRHAKEFLAGKSLPDGFALLTDPDYTFTNAYRLRWDAKNETAYPSTFVIGKDGVIRYAVVSKTHVGRTQAAEVLKAIPAK